MKARWENLREKEIIEEINKNKKHKIKWENYEISKGISLKIVSHKVEKADKNIEGNYIFKLDNYTHYDVDVEFDFSKSENIKSYTEEGLIFKEHFNPFSNEIKSQDEFPLLNNIALYPENSLNIGASETGYEQDIDIHLGRICEIRYYKDFNVKSILKFFLNFPSKEKQSELIKKDDQQISNTLELFNNKFSSRNYEKLSDDLKKFIKENHIEYFVDPLFPPTDFKNIKLNAETSTNSGEQEVLVHWRPIASLLSQENSDNTKGSLYDIDKISPIEIIYGWEKLDNVISVLTHLAEYPCLIKRIVEEKYEVCCECNIYVNGSRTKTIVDLLIPCFPKSFPIYTYSRQSGWPMIIEKVLAKLYHGYENLSKIKIENIYYALTGFHVMTIDLSKYRSVKKKTKNYHGDFFEKIKEYYNMGYIMSAECDKDSFQVVEIKKDLNYPILEVNLEEGQKIITIRNIFSDSTEKQKSYKNLQDKHNDITINFLKSEEFVDIFSRLIVIHSGSYFEKSFRSKFIHCQDSVYYDLKTVISHHYYKVSNKENHPITLKVLLKLYDDEEGLFYCDKHDMSIGVLSIDENNKYKIMKYTGFCLEKSVYMDLDLDPGEYIIFPRTMGYGMKTKENKENCNPINSDKSLNFDLLEKVFEYVFYIHDYDCSGDLDIVEAQKVINRLRGQLNKEEYQKYINQYCYAENAITKKAFVNILKDIFSEAKNDPSVLYDYLKNLGYDRYCYPYLYRFFSIQFMSECQKIVIHSKNNIHENFDMILCKLILEKCDGQPTDNEKIEIVTYKPP